MIITDKAFLSGLEMKVIRPTMSVTLSYEPLAHSSRKNDLRWICGGGCIGLYSAVSSTPLPQFRNNHFFLICDSFSKDIGQQLFEDIKLLKPTTLAGVPRFWNVIYSEYKKALSLALAKRALEEEAKQQAHQAQQTQQETPEKEKEKEGERVGVVGGGGYWFVEEVEREVMQEFRGMLGGRMQGITTGGAPTSEAVKKFLADCYQCVVVESYGITETGGNNPHDVVVPACNSIMHRDYLSGSDSERRGSR